MRTPFKILFGLVILTLVACNQPEPSPASTATPVPTDTVVTPTHVPTIVPTLPPTPTPTPTPQIPPIVLSWNNDWRDACVSDATLLILALYGHTEYQGGMSRDYMLGYQVLDLVPLVANPEFQQDLPEIVAEYGDNPAGKVLMFLQFPSLTANDELVLGVDLVVLEPGQALPFLFSDEIDEVDYDKWVSFLVYDGQDATGNFCFSINEAEEPWVIEPNRIDPFQLPMPGVRA
ncbi:hypothetical protein KC571_03390 [candidate division WWE3 bacterium]|uniref:Uncharacterized protein n=1 Tax=candidate division WWE3 bacterium TaxID=2053526 RepID=A0A955LH19_UNCKA|nr:hypothetical protein [candidate division WWE3 bacterium]